jgi:prostatic aicd phosphatase
MSPAKHRSVGAEAARQWNIYDYMNVNNIHNGTFAGSIPKGYMEQARALATQD